MAKRDRSKCDEFYIGRIRSDVQNFEDKTAVMKAARLLANSEGEPVDVFRRIAMGRGVVFATVRPDGEENDELLRR